MRDLASLLVGSLCCWLGVQLVTLGSHLVRWGHTVFMAALERSEP